MPFGLKNAPSVFQRYINKALRDLIDIGLIVVYMDDILIATNTIEDHVDVLTKILRRISECELELQLKKCKFAYNEVEFLGFVASGNGIKPGKIKTEAIENFPIPKNVKEVQSFIDQC